MTEDKKDEAIKELRLDYEALVGRIIDLQAFYIKEFIQENRGGNFYSSGEILKFISKLQEIIDI